MGRGRGGRWGQSMGQHQSGTEGVLERDRFHRTALFHDRRWLLLLHHCRCSFSCYQWGALQLLLLPLPLPVQTHLLQSDKQVPPQGPGPAQHVEAPLVMDPGLGGRAGGSLHSGGSRNIQWGNPKTENGSYHRRDLGQNGLGGLKAT